MHIGNMIIGMTTYYSTNISCEKNTFSCKSIERWLLPNEQEVEHFLSGRASCQGATRGSVEALRFLHQELEKRKEELKEIVQDSRGRALNLNMELSHFHPVNRFLGPPCTTAHGMYNPVYGVAHVTEPMLQSEKSWALCPGRGLLRYHLLMFDHPDRTNPEFALSMTLVCQNPQQSITQSNPPYGLAVRMMEQIPSSFSAVPMAGPFQTMSV